MESTEPSLPNLQPRLQPPASCPICPVISYTHLFNLGISLSVHFDLHYLLISFLNFPAASRFDGRITSSIFSRASNTSDLVLPSQMQSNHLYCCYCYYLLLCAKHSISFIGLHLIVFCILVVGLGSATGSFTQLLCWRIALTMNSKLVLSIFSPVARSVVFGFPFLFACVQFTYMCSL